MGAPSALGGDLGAITTTCCLRPAVTGPFSPLDQASLQHAQTMHGTAVLRGADQRQ